MTELHFAGPDGGSRRFPEPWELRRLGEKSSGKVELAAFVERAWAARDRFWVLDPHFFEYGLHGAQLALSQSKILDVRFLTEPLKKESKKCKSDVDTTIRRAWSAGYPEGTRVPVGTTFQWRDRLQGPDSYPFVHDRFVILDDQLWHFGFAACGSSKHLSAATGPWDAQVTGAALFYSRLWEEFRDR